MWGKLYPHVVGLAPEVTGDVWETRKKGPELPAMLGWRVVSYGTGVGMDSV